MFRLGGWAPRLPTGLLVSCGTLVSVNSLHFSLTGLLPSLAALSSAVQLSFKMYITDPQPRKACSSVWPVPSSLAATERIDFSFLSSGYLDVSVPRVPFYKAMYLPYDDRIPPAGFPHSDIHGSKPACGSP